VLSRIAFSCRTGKEALKPVSLAELRLSTLIPSGLARLPLCCHQPRGDTVRPPRRIMKDGDMSANNAAHSPSAVAHRVGLLCITSRRQDLTRLHTVLPVGTVARGLYDRSNKQVQ
jgi:hypothetical protein